MEENKFDLDVEESGLEAAGSRNMSRRSFIAGSAALAATMVLATGCTSSDDEDEEDEGSAVDDSAEDEDEEEEEATTEADAEAEDEDDWFPITVTDMTGNEVTIESEPQSIAALLGSSYSYPFFLDASDRVSCRMGIDDKADEWCSVIDPDFSSYGTVDFEFAMAQNPDVEELLELGVDIAYYFAGMDEQKANMEEVGIAVVEAGYDVAADTTVDEWRGELKDQLLMYGDTLGREAAEKAEKWCDYVDEQLDMVAERTADLSDDEKPDVYWMRSQEDGLQCFVQLSQASFVCEIAGANLVTKDIEGQGTYATVTIEEVADWNPDVIFMGWMADKTLITENEQWASFDAVINDQVYTLPCSTTTTDWSFTPEVGLEAIYVAQILHPDLFDDIDMITEIKDFYSTFFDCDLTDDQAQAMMDRKSPSEI